MSYRRSVLKSVAADVRARLNPRLFSAPESRRAAKSPFCSAIVDSKATQLPQKPFDIPQFRRENKYFKISPEVDDALQTRKPVVALETTIYTHGFPYPDNVALALDLESIVRRNGGVPATIGILEGVARVGMSTEQLREIAASAGKSETMKVSRRDLPYVLGLGIAGRRLNGGTTIAGTMFLAQRAGIKVFGTGGLGGVHRGGQDTMDVSADLTELGRTPVAVISSGCKSFLDIPRTLEYLETQGVGVFTFADGRTGDIDFPAFYTRESGVQSPQVLQDEREAAAIIFSQSFFSGNSGLLFANPVPEEFSIPKNEIDFAIDQAVKEAAEQQIHGHANTPFILARIKELTKGNSLPVNRALIESNVTVATRIAVEYSKFRAEDFTVTTGWSKPVSASSLFTPLLPSEKNHPEKDKTIQNRPEIGIPPPEPDVLVHGSVAMDLSCNYIPISNNIDTVSAAEPSSQDNGTSPQLYTSNMATISPSVGGVGHNVALAAYLAGGGNVSVRLCSYVADDLAGHSIQAALKEEGLDTIGITTLPIRRLSDNCVNRTAQYVAINDTKKDLVMAMADMGIFSGPLPEPIFRETSSKGKWTVVDANWNAGRIRSILANRNAANVAFEPVSVAKSAQLFQPDFPGLTGAERYTVAVDVFPKNLVDLATPNQYELAAMHASAKNHELFESDRWWQIIDALGIPSTGARNRFVALTSPEMTDEGIPLQSVQLLPFIPTILTKLGAEGVLMTKLLKPDDWRLKDPAEAPYIISRTSNGNTEVGGTYMRLFPATEKVNDIVSVNGVGDTFLGVLIAGLARGAELDKKLINIAQKGAIMTLRSTEAVSPQVGIAGKLKRDEALLAAAGF